jgi:hypothetical protein
MPSWATLVSKEKFLLIFQKMPPPDGSGIKISDVPSIANEFLMSVFPMAGP